MYYYYYYFILFLIHDLTSSAEYPPSCLNEVFRSVQNTEVCH